MVLAAFILNILSSVGSGICLIFNLFKILFNHSFSFSEIISSIIYLTIGILMSVFTYQIYKGSRKNTIAIGIIDLIFANPISGILLLIDHEQNKDKYSNNFKDLDVEIIDIDKENK